MTKKQALQRIREMKKKKTFIEIGQIFGTSGQLVQYWLSRETIGKVYLDKVISSLNRRKKWGKI